jgi:uncharacterized protein (TIGR00255 family)
MSLQSMTGFARADARHGAVRFHWELRSVNSRGLDLRLRLPPGHDALEAPVREAVTKRLARGSVTATLAIDQAAEAAAIRINAPALALVLDTIARLAETGRFERPRPEGVLALRGVIESGSVEPDEAEAALFREALLGALGQALDGLVAARRSEGARLGDVLATLLDRIEAHVAAITASPVRTPEAISRRLADQVARLLATGSNLDADRLHQEAVLLATRADVEEELQRLRAHIAAARALLAEAVPVGRRLDFLTQEFNREANTICSKANDIALTRLGLELKAVIDQVREQVQNIE